MANQQQVNMLLRGGVAVWNQWRNENPEIPSDLSGADLREADLHGANLGEVDLHEANLAGANLIRAKLIDTSLAGANLSGAYLSGVYAFLADLSWADLRAAHLIEADLRAAHLIGADLRRADLSWANLGGAEFGDADLRGADLSGAICTRADFSGATLTECNVYGVSAWDVNLEGAVQADLRITPPEVESHITVDNLKVAQFLYVLMHDDEMRAVLDTITSKVVLILGRFSDERKPILDALREALRRHPNGYVPVLFDFEPQADKPVLETVKTLANLARFVIADLTDPHMVRAELTAIIPNVPTVPIQPLVEGNAGLPTEYESWALYRSVLPVYRYVDRPQLLASLNESVITPVEAHVQARRL